MFSDKESKALLPIGFCDLLPPDAAHEASVIESIMKTFSLYGYDRVKPPLVEFEESLFASEDAGIKSQTFRFMDYYSQRMMGIRTDTTIQIARIAATRMANDSRPLRLCYSGQVLRVKGTELRPARQFTQAGIELIGADSSLADAEIIIASCAALNSVGIKKVSIDLNSPVIVPLVCEKLNLNKDVFLRLLQALDRKDMTDVVDLLSGFGDEGKKAIENLAVLVKLTGNIKKALSKIESLDLPEKAKNEIARLSEVASIVFATNPEINLTVDFVENRGFEYHTGVSFSIFVEGAQGELGRGGRYQTAEVANVSDKNKKRETATGVTLFVDEVTKFLIPQIIKNKVFVPFAEDLQEAEKLRAKGYVVICGLFYENDLKKQEAEALKLGCNSIYIDGAIKKL